MGYYAAGGAGTAVLGWAYRKARKAVASVPYGEEFNQVWDWGTEKAMGYYNGGDVRPGLGGLSADAPRFPGSSAADYGYTPPSGGGGGGGGGRSYRRTNPMNVRAARRAIRRLTSFARIAKSIYAFTHKPKGGGGHFKLKRRRKSC